MGFLDFIFPKYCVNCRKVGDYICPNCFSFLSFDVSMICLACNKGSYDGLTHPRCRGRYVIDGAFSAIAYKGIVKKLIYNFKYKPFLSDLNSTLTELFYESIIQNEIFQKAYASKPTLVPIPLHANRLIKRGYNHSELLAKGLEDKLNLKIINVLKRTKNTKSQFGLKLEERKENISDSFAISSKVSIPKYVFLVDDILTTGSTLLEAARILKRNGAKKVWGLTLSRD